MENTSLALTVPLRDGADFIPLARAVLDAIGVVAPLPSPEAFVSPMRVAHGEGTALRVVLTHSKQPADPYAGGSIDTRALSVEASATHHLRVRIDEIVWVGDELSVRVVGSAAWVAAVEPVVRAFVTAWGR